MRTSVLIASLLFASTTTASPIFPEFIKKLYKRTLGEGYTSCSTSDECIAPMVCEGGYCTPPPSNPLCGHPLENEAK